MEEIVRVIGTWETHYFRGKRIKKRRFLWSKESHFHTNKSIFIDNGVTKCNISCNLVVQKSQKAQFSFSLYSKKGAYFSSKGCVGSYTTQLCDLDSCSSNKIIIHATIHNFHTRSCDSSQLVIQASMCIIHPFTQTNHTIITIGITNLIIRF